MSFLFPSPSQFILFACLGRKANTGFIDGAWPPSSISPSNTYIYDASPPSAPQSSLYTFLIYLNDDFLGGETTFFIPSVKEGVLNAYPVKPIMVCQPLLTPRR